MSGHASWVSSVAFSPDNKHFVSGSADNTVKLWALQDRQCIHTFTEHVDQVLFMDEINKSLPYQLLCRCGELSSALTARKLCPCLKTSL
jgi:WD40 repeat protein